MTSLRTKDVTHRSNAPALVVSRPSPTGAKDTVKDAVVAWSVCGAALGVFLIAMAGFVGGV